MNAAKCYTQGSKREYISKKNPALMANIIAPTERQKREILIRQVGDGESDLSIKWASVAAACELLCPSITSHEYRGKTISTGAELAEFGDSQIVWEIGCEILEELSLSREKKDSSKIPSGSSPPETHVSNGTAVDASSKVETNSEGADLGSPPTQDLYISSTVSGGSENVQKLGSNMTSNTLSG